MGAMWIYLYDEPKQLETWAVYVYVAGRWSLVADLIGEIKNLVAALGHSRCGLDRWGAERFSRILP